MKITIGALAHVDAGKTTLSESILYKTNVIRSKGRVDNKDSFLDYYNIEKQKGITVYNKQANFKYKNKDYIYIDTPGHNDLAYETSRALSILDVAILIVSAIDDIPSDTIKKFNNLLNYNIPILIFINKMDITTYTKDEILTKIKDKLSIDCIEYQNIYEQLSLTSDELLDEYLNTQTINSNTIINALKSNLVFPCFFGSALKDQGIDELLDFIDQYIIQEYNPEGNLNAYVYKLAQDYTYLKVLSGTLINKMSFGEYKVNEIYEINGNNFNPINEAKASDIVAVKGLKDIALGTYLPSFNVDELYVAPSLQYRIIQDLNPNEFFKLAQSIILEYPELKIELDKNNIYINLCGELHETIVSNMFYERLGIKVEFSDPIIKYKETINEEVYGVGHFEPLRHYAEVIVKLKPYKDGIKISSNLDNSYINTILSYLRNYPIRGILTNSPLTNIEIEIVDIKTHPKHTEGGDLIKASKRAIRQALSKINSQLLQPYYLTSIDTDESNINTIISYLTNLNLNYTISNNTILSSIPLVSFNNTITGLRSRLKGQISFSIEDSVYDSVDNQESIISKINYDYRHDEFNPAGSIFCKSGAGHYVEPECVEDNMHLNMSDYIVDYSKTTIVHNKSKISEDELLRVWNGLYKPKQRYVERKTQYTESEYHKAYSSKPILYLIDGYNLMYYLDEDNAIANIISARENIINIVCDFSGYVQAEVILVFDAYKTNSHSNEVIDEDNIKVVYTKQKQSADNYIEIKSKELSDKYKVIVVTSDSAEQLRVFANNASRISSREFINRYNNLRKNNTKLNDNVRFKPLQDLRKLLEED